MNSLAEALPSDESVGKVQNNPFSQSGNSSGSQGGSQSQSQGGSQSGSQGGSQSGSQGGYQSGSQPFPFDFTFFPPAMNHTIPFIQMPPFDSFKGDIETKKAFMIFILPLLKSV